MEEHGVDNPMKKGETSEESRKVTQSQRRGIISRIWRGVFGVRNEDYEKKLHRLSKEEAEVNARMKRRSESSRKRARNLIMLSVTFEVIAVAIAVLAVRSLDFTGPMKFFRTLPAILLPCLSYIIYSSFESLTKILDRKDQKTLERLRAERKAKIDELKERTNYYTTQQLIQRYDLDPAAKVAAATVLASRLGAESGLKVNIGDKPANLMESTKSSGGSFELSQSNALQQRKQPSTREGILIKSPEDVDVVGSDHQGHVDTSPGPIIVEHYKGSGSSDNGWVARIAALLFAEDPSQCSALICGNCHKHNGLVRKEEFPHVTYYCPHCHALNTSKQTGDHELLPLTSSPKTSEALSTTTSAEINSNDAENIQELQESAAT